MNVLIFFQENNGGTNTLLKRAENWFSSRGHLVQNSKELDKYKATNFDLVLLPTSEIFNFYRQRKYIYSENIIIWAMGSRAFSGTIINQFNQNSIYKIASYPVSKIINFTLFILVKNRAIIFTDEVGLNSESNYNNDYQDLIFPIPIDIDKSIIPKASSELKKFMWVGRIDKDFKILPLLKIIEDIDRAIKNGIIEKNVQLTIIGSGDSLGILKVHIAAKNNIKFKILEHMKIDQLHATIKKDADILIAMGTSALEGAALGIPTLIIQPFSRHDQQKKNLYRWIGDSLGYSLGEFTWVNSCPEQINHTFEGVLKSANLIYRANQSYEFSKKFNKDIIFTRLISRNKTGKYSPLLNLLLGVIYAINKIKLIFKNLLKNAY